MAPEWYVSIKAVEWKTRPPVTVGSHVAFAAHFLGRRMAYTYEVVELIPGERLVMRTAEGPFPMETFLQMALAVDRWCRASRESKGSGQPIPGEDSTQGGVR